MSRAGPAASAPVSAWVLRQVRATAGVAVQQQQIDCLPIGCAANPQELNSCGPCSSILWLVLLRFHQAPPRAQSPSVCMQAR